MLTLLPAEKGDLGGSSSTDQASELSATRN
jgi:hypothetical protein